MKNLSSQQIISYAIALILIMAMIWVFLISKPCDGNYKLKIGGSEYFLFECTNSNENSSNSNTGNGSISGGTTPSTNSITYDCPNKKNHDDNCNDNNQMTKNDKIQNDCSCKGVVYKIKDSRNNDEYLVEYINGLYWMVEDLRIKDPYKKGTQYFESGGRVYYPNGYESFCPAGFRFPTDSELQSLYKNGEFVDKFNSRIGFWDRKENKTSNSNNHFGYFTKQGLVYFTNGKKYTNAGATQNNGYCIRCVKER